MDQKIKYLNLQEEEPKSTGFSALDTYLGFHRGEVNYWIARQI